MGYSVTRTSTLSPQTIWSRWTRSPNWMAWHPFFRDLQLDAPLEVRARGGARLKVSPLLPALRSTFVVTAIRRPEWVQVKCPVRGAQLIVTIQIRSSGDLTWVTESISWRGPLAWWYTTMQPSSVFADLESGLECLLASCQSEEPAPQETPATVHRGPRPVPPSLLQAA